MLLSNKTCLCYIRSEYLWEWIEKSNQKECSLQDEKFKWEKIISIKPGFFSDTDLLLVYQNIILLKVISDNHASFLVKNYKLEYQKVCQKVFSEKKNIIFISDQQWKEKKNDEKLIVLFKDEESIKNSLQNWLEEIKNENQV